jgi:hypothetical protein
LCFFSVLRMCRLAGDKFFLFLSDRHRYSGGVWQSGHRLARAQRTQTDASAEPMSRSARGGRSRLLVFGAHAAGCGRQVCALPAAVCGFRAVPRGFPVMHDYLSLSSGGGFEQAIDEFLADRCGTGATGKA